MVVTALPVSSRPTQGEFVDFDRNHPASTVQTVEGSNTQTSASDPTESVP